MGKLNGKCKGKEWYHPKSSSPAKKNDHVSGTALDSEFPKVCSIMHG